MVRNFRESSGGLCPGEICLEPRRLLRRRHSTLFASQGRCSSAKMQRVRRWGRRRSRWAIHPRKRARVVRELVPSSRPGAQLARGALVLAQPKPALYIQCKPRTQRILQWAAVRSQVSSHNLPVSQDPPRRGKCENAHGRIGSSESWNLVSGSSCREYINRPAPWRSRTPRPYLSQVYILEK